MKLVKLVTTKFLFSAFAAFLLFVGISIVLVFAVSFTATTTPQIVDSGTVNQTFNFTITNSGSVNITQVNITLPSGFTYISGTNGTSSATSLFSSSSSTLIWDNTTATAAVVNTTEYFWFNATISKTTYGNVTFNISVNNITGAANSTNSTLVSILVERTAWSSPNETFYVKPFDTWINWTNAESNGVYVANLSVITNRSRSDNITIEALNSTQKMQVNYTQTTGGTTSCDVYVSVRNSTGDYNATYIAALNGSSSATATNFTLVYTYNTWKYCYPGRYATSRFTVRNQSSSESANVTVYLDIPVLPSNSTGLGTFNGVLPANATAYHAFFFNASNLISSWIVNATSVFINVSSTSDIDVFLLDNSGNLRAKAANKTIGDEIIRYNYLTASDNMWEIRIYGNSSNSTIFYSGTIILTSLNATNSSSSESVTSLSPLNFGLLNATSNTTANITLSNVGNISLSAVNESKEMYLIRKFSGSTAANFTMLVPDSSIASRLKASLNWTGAANYSLRVYNAAGTMVGESTGKHAYANVSRVEQEEYNETSSFSSTPSTWKIEVYNNTDKTGSYEVTVNVYVDASSWLATNFTSYAGATSNFNTSGQNNSTYPILINLTTPTSALNGTYQGKLKYLDSRRAGVEIPIKVEVTAPMLVVNGTMSSGTYRLDENYGANLTRYMYLNISNFGDIPMYLNFTGAANLTSGGYNASLTFNTTGQVNAGASKMIQATISFNSSMPAATYTGSILVNATNATANLTSRPYTYYTINLQLNLTSVLEVRISARSSNNSFVVNSSRAENITVKADVFYVNETTNITNLGGLGNFTSVWLVEGNVSGALGRIPATGSLTKYNGTGDQNAPFCFGSPVDCPSFGGNNHYYVNATVPSDKIGGRYYVYTDVSYAKDTDPHTYNGTGVSLTNETIVIDNVGIFMSTNASGCSFGTTDCNASISMTNTSTYTYYINISNYGPRDANASDAPVLSENCSGFSASPSVTYANCPSTSFAVPGYNTSCLAYWTITASNAAYDACSAQVTGGISGHYYNAQNLSITVTKASVTTTTAPAIPSSSNVTTTTVPAKTANLSFTQAESLISLLQNSSNATVVIVKNIGTKNQSINFSIVDVNSSLYTINATSATLLVGQSAGFLVTFKVGVIDVKDYVGKYKAYSSETSETSGFILRVLPLPEKKVEINNTLSLLQANITKLWTEINKTKSEKSGINLTAAEQKIADASAQVDLAEQYISNGDYFNAYQLFDSIKSLVAGAETELEAAKVNYDQTHWPNWLIWALVAAGIGGGGLLIYLLWPTRGYDEKARKYFSKTSEKQQTQQVQQVKPLQQIKPQQVRPYGRFATQPEAAGLKEKVSGNLSKLKNVFKKNKQI